MYSIDAPVRQKADSLSGRKGKGICSLLKAAENAVSGNVWKTL
jgi:hypothetical protein